MRFLSTPFAALILLSSVTAYKSQGYELDVPCPEGFLDGFVHNSYTYNAPPQKFINITKSYDASWYGGAVVSNTTGTDNVPGATRAGNLDGDFFETLTAYSSGPAHLEYSYRGAPYTFTMPNSTAPSNVQFSSYGETFRFEGICSGRATYIDVITYMCSVDQTAGYDWWFGGHQGIFSAVAERVGATEFMGNCPE
ncbi:hypothetical protein C8R46DRAFT_1071306 [Mycena filopes]|nr:hypothetical protein C8R46DRAFT_1071306 [Mycena filopes]